MKPIVQLIEEYAERVIDDMDMDTLCSFAKVTVEDDLSGLSEAEIIETVREYYPELLES